MSVEVKHCIMDMPVLFDFLLVHIPGFVSFMFHVDCATSQCLLRRTSYLKWLFRFFSTYHCEGLNFFTSAGHFGKY